KFKRRPKPPCNSFTGETLVHTENRTRPIEDIQIGDKVLSQAEWNGENSYQEVTDVITGERVYDMVSIGLENGEVIETTSGHPFFVHDLGWRDASLLKVGDVLVVGDQREMKVSSIAIEERVETVYNLTVANTRTFFVGVDGVLVHNVNCNKKSGRNEPHANQKRREEAKKKYQAAKDAVEQAKRDGMSQKERRKLEKTRDHWKKKMDYKGDTDHMKG
ncbi:MAG: hypothetical protein GY705_03285, partial [Bacteroidetes bacterium]|nr:hypothetical protein [Bacteroidota bacterium]